MEPLTVIVDGENYEKAEHYSKICSSNFKKSRYGRGFANTYDDPLKVQRIGKIAEFAFAQTFGGEVDCEYRPKGDLYDVIYRGKRVDVKTALKLREVALVTYMKENCSLYDYSNVDFFFFTYLKNEDPVKKYAEIVLMGWLLVKDLDQFPIKISRFGGIYNREVDYEKLNPIEELFNL